VTHGLVVGKFYPPHLGHRYLIDTARSRCDSLDVLVVDEPGEDPPASVRGEWMREIHPDVNVMLVPDIQEDDDSVAWARHSQRYVTAPIDVVFTAEAYGEPFAEALGCQHEFVGRDRFPVSGSQIRAHPSEWWAYLEPVVRAHYVARIVVLGAESTGTTTLARALADEYDTVWVPEYGWTYSEGKLAVGDFERWTSSDFVRVAREQIRREDHLAREARHGLMFCDTDPLATTVWHERYVGTEHPGLVALADSRRYALYLLTNHDVPFEEGPLRDGKDIREWMTDRFRQVLDARATPWFLMTDSLEDRVKEARSLIDRQIDTVEGGHS
jgi:NadR type nicotinamide-nucleotide adenylyltransferase